MIYIFNNNYHKGLIFIIFFNILNQLIIILELKIEFTEFILKSQYFKIGVVNFNV